MSGFYGGRSEWTPVVKRWRWLPHWFPFNRKRGMTYCDIVSGYPK